VLMRHDDIGRCPQCGREMLLHGVEKELCPLCDEDQRDAQSDGGGADD